MSLLFDIHIKVQDKNTKILSAGDFQLRCWPCTEYSRVSWHCESNNLLTRGVFDDSTGRRLPSDAAKLKGLSPSDFVVLVLGVLAGLVER